MNILRSFPFIDFVLSGEAEHSTPRFLASLAGTEPLSRVPGLAYRNYNDIALGEENSLPIDLGKAAP